MKAKDVEVGGQYTMAFGCVQGVVTIMSELPEGGWEAKSASGKAIKIKLANRLFGRVKEKAVAVNTPVTKDKPKAKEQKTSKVMSLLDAASQVLQAEGRPMSCGEIYDACVNKGLWATQSGKTPMNTLYSAILREIGNKGVNARFVKVERGRFQSC
jgi:hypothetical protein